MDNNFIVGLKLKKRRKNRARWILFLMLILTLGTGVSVIFNSGRGELVSPLVKIKTPITEKSLKTAVENALIGTKGTYGIAIKNLGSGESYYFSEYRSFEAGSLYKLWIMAIVFDKIQNGQLSKEQVLSEKVATLNKEFDIDPEWAELTEGIVTMTVGDALLQMITISHNYAALLLTKEIKLSQVSAFLKENGFGESSVGDGGGSPKTTPSDIAIFLEKLYKGELVGPQYTSEMIDLLKGQKLDGGLPKYLPAELQVANKTGDIGNFKHDAGIVFTDRGNYVIVVMSESDSPAGAQERIAQISKAVYDYFSSL